MDQIQQVIQLLQAAQRSGAVSPVGNGSGSHAGLWATETDAPSGPNMHGPGGIFGVLGLEEEVISTRIAPRGLIGRLPARGSDTLWPEFPFLMGFTEAEDGSDPEFDAQGLCDDGPMAGAITGCIQSAWFGRYTYETRAIDITQVGRRINRGEFRDLRLIGQVLDPTSNVTPASTVADKAQLLENEAVERMVEVGIAYNNKLIRQTYTGNPAMSNTGGGYREFVGLDLLIRTGHRDAHTKELCPGLDSLIVDFANKKTDDAAGLTLVNTMTWMYRILRYKAERSGLTPASWYVTMRQAAFWEIAAVWACAYWSYRCATTADGPNGENVVGSIDVRDSVNFRDDMRNNNYLLIDGQRVEVVIDDGIPENLAGSGVPAISAGCWGSNIYFIPRLVNGNLAATFLEYYDYRESIDAAREFGFRGSEFWTDGGRFLWIRKTPKLNCIQLHSVFEPRIILRTPHLAGKLLNVQYCPTMHEPGALPGDVGYQDAGVDTRPANSGIFDNDQNEIP